MPSRSPWGRGQVIELAPRKFLLRWSAGNDPFTGRRVRQTLTLHDVSRAEANRILGAKIAARRTTTRLTLGELIDTTLDQLDVADRTRDGYRIALAHIPDGARKWRVDDLTVTKAGTLIAGLSERHGPQTVRKAVGALQSCWKQAYRNGWVSLDDSPWKAHKLPELRTRHSRILTDQEIDAVRAAADGPMEQAWIELALATGARPGEIVGLRRSDVDLDNSVIRFVDHKHRGQPRHVAIGEHAATVLENWFEQQDARADELEPDPYVLSMDVEGKTPWRAEYASKYRWHALAARAQLRPRVDTLCETCWGKGLREVGDGPYETWTVTYDCADCTNGCRPGKTFKSELPLYSLRHTHNSLLAAAGVSAAVRGKRIGNTEDTNRSTYTHLVPREDREAAAIIDQRLGQRS